MSGWILVLIALALLAWSLVRERFVATASIQAPPYNDAAKRRIFQTASTANQQTLLDRVRLLPSAPTETAKLEVAAGGLLAPVVGAFFTEVFAPATVPLTVADVDAFLTANPSDMTSIETDVLTQYFVNQQGLGGSAYTALLAASGQNPGYLSAAGPPPPSSGQSTASAPTPVCPVGTIRRAEDGLCVASAPGPAPECPPGYTQTPEGRCQRTGGTEVTDANQCPAGYDYNTVTRGCDTLPVNPSCPGDFVYRDRVCVARTATTSASTTTGGTSATTYGPTSGGLSSRVRQVFGPQFTGTGGDVKGPGGDSSLTNVYPQLLGGLMDTSSRIPGAGITSPSKSWTLANDGTLPPKTSMGSDEMSRYFPFSRSPGDMDIVADPYRVAQSFSTSSYSSKTEPVPFLTDFSAFQS